MHRELLCRAVNVENLTREELCVGDEGLKFCVMLGEQQFGVFEEMIIV